MKIKVRRSGSQLAQIAARAGDANAILARMGGYIRAGARARIEQGENMAPWAESTRRRYEQTGSSKVTRHGAVRSSYAQKLGQYLQRKGNSDAVEELRSLLRGGRVSASNTKAIATLSRQLDRAAKKRPSARKIGKRRIESAILLGKMALLFAMVLDGKKVKVLNKASFSAVQNDGGTVGNGAVIPERRFLEITSHTRARITEIALDHLMGRSR